MAAPLQPGAFGQCPLQGCQPLCGVGEHSCGNGAELAVLLGLAGTGRSWAQLAVFLGLAGTGRSWAQVFVLVLCTEFLQCIEVSLALSVV